MSTVETRAPGAEIREQFDHPVIDGDGHFLECFPVLDEYVAAQGITPVRHRPDREIGREDARVTDGDRAYNRYPRWSWWSVPARNTLDHATTLLPSLFYERLEELGIDFSIMFPTAGVMYTKMGEEELRRASCRGLNHYVADVFRDLRDRLEPAAAVPMHTPGEAIDELEHAVNDLHLKTIMIPAFVERPIGAAEAAMREYPEIARFNTWLDCYGIDSPYDYDPFWARCVELGVSVSSHSPGFGKGFRTSVSNYVYNHIGNFASASHALCKSLFIGGVTRRFPQLRVAFLEGGTGWASALLADLIGHWDKRNGDAVHHYDPASIDMTLLKELQRKHGGLLANADLDDYRSSLQTSGGAPDELDDFEACGIEKASDIVDLFVPSFYFGCEADDPMTRTAFTGNPFGARLHAMFSSDVGHWDVPDMRDVLVEAYEMVDDGLLTETDFRAFTFENPARFHTEANPQFFDGTAVAESVDKEFDLTLRDTLAAIDKEAPTP